MGRFYMVRGKIAAAVMTGLFALTAVGCLNPLSASMSLVMLYYLAPVFLPFTLCQAGILPGAVCLALSCAGWGMALGQAGMTVALIYYLPSLAAFVLLSLRFRQPHPRPALILAVTVALSQTVLYLMLQSALDGKAFQIIADTAAETIRESDWGDTLLYLLNDSGVLPLTVNAENAVTIQDGLYVLSDTVRDNLLSSLVLLIENALEIIIPALLVGNSIYLGALISAFPLGWAKRLNPALEKEMPLPDKLMDEFRHWYIPRKWGWQMALLGLLGFILMQMEAPALYTLGNIFFQVFSGVFTIQALALINSRQWDKGRHTWWRVLLPVILMWFLSSYIWIVGLVDQAADFRSLRGPRKGPGDREEE